MEDTLKTYRKLMIDIENKVNKIIQSSFYKVNAYSSASFSRYGEDILIMNAFRQIGIKHPTYIDIGAYHPLFFSNTALMHQSDCKGINIEPNPYLFKNFIKFRHDDINICCAIGKQNCTKKFYIPNEMTNMSILYNDRFCVNNNQIYSFFEQKIVDIDVMTINKIIEMNGNNMPQYMSCNIGSMEEDIIKSYDFSIDDDSKVPIIITIAVHDRGVIEYFSKCGYSLYLKIYNIYTFVKNKYLSKI